MSYSIDLAGPANLVGVGNQSITSEEIYAFIQSHRHFSTEALKIDPFDGEWLFLPVLTSIIDNPDTPLKVRETANAMYRSEFIRGW
jgi:hypothetical protein